MKTKDPSTPVSRARPIERNSSARGVPETRGNPPPLRMLRTLEVVKRSGG